MHIWVGSIFWLFQIKMLWTSVHKSLCTHVFSFSSGKYPGVELLCHWESICLTLREAGTQLSKLLVPSDIATSDVWAFYPSGCVRIRPCSFDWRFPDDLWYWIFFHVLIGHLYFFFYKESRSFAYLKTQVVYNFIVDFWKFYTYYRFLYYKYFLLVYSLTFHFPNDVFW